MQTCPSTSRRGSDRVRLMRLTQWWCAAAAAATLAGCGGGDDGPLPLPGPSPTPIQSISCPSQGGSGTNGLSLFGLASYSNLSGSSSSTGTVTLDPGEVSYNNPNLSSTARTGSLRASLWAVSSSYGGGGINGYVVARYGISFTGGGNQLTNGQSSNLVSQTLSATTPPRGAYCMVVTLEQYDSVSCSSADRYCIMDWQQFATNAIFQ